MLTETQIEKFREIYRKRFGREITREFAVEVGTKLVFIMRAVYKPLSVKKTESQMISAMPEV